MNGFAGKKKKEKKKHFCLLKFMGIKLSSSSSRLSIVPIG